MEAIFVVIILLLIATIFYLEIRYKKLKDNHLQTLEKLHQILVELTHKQKQSEIKLHLADDFNGSVRQSETVIANEILALQKDFLNILSENKLLV